MGCQTTNPSGLPVSQKAELLLTELLELLVVDFLVLICVAMLKNQVGATTSLLLDGVKPLALLALLRTERWATLAETLAFEFVVLRHVVISFGLLARVGVGGSKYT